MADFGAQVDWLLSGIQYNGSPLSGGKVYTYAAGTSTDKATYTDRAKTTPAANPIILNSEGRAQVYADGIYKFIVKTSADALVATYDNVAYTQADEGAMVYLSAYDSLLDAITAIGSNEVTLILDANSTLSANLTIPANVNLVPVNGFDINVNTFTLTLSGSIQPATFQWIIGASGIVNGTPTGSVYQSVWVVGTVTNSLVTTGFDVTFDSVTGNDISGQDVTVNKTLMQTYGGELTIAAGALTLGDGNVFKIANTTGDLDTISTSGKVGSTIGLLFASAGVTIQHSANIDLPNGQDIVVPDNAFYEFVEFPTAGKYFLKNSRIVKYGSVGLLAVDTPQIVDAAITQAKLKTTLVDQVVNFVGVDIVTALAGGEYSFFPQFTNAATSPTQHRWFLGAGLAANGTYYTNIILDAAANLAYGNAVLGTRNRYVTSSGEIFWVFICRDKVTKVPMIIWAAPDHPCFGTGQDDSKVQHPFPAMNFNTHELVVCQYPMTDGKYVDWIQDNLGNVAAWISLNGDVDDESNPDWISTPITIGVGKGEEVIAGNVVSTVKKSIERQPYFIVKQIKVDSGI